MRRNRSRKRVMRLLIAVLVFSGAVATLASTVIGSQPVVLVSSAEPSSPGPLLDVCEDLLRRHVPQHSADMGDAASEMAEARVVACRRRATSISIQLSPLRINRVETTDEVILVEVGGG